MKKTAIAVVAMLVMVSLAGCESFVLKTVMGTVDPYFHGPGIDGTNSRR